MSKSPSGRLHLGFWVTAGVLLYVASCPPVEAWHESERYSSATNTVGSGPAPRRGSIQGEQFEILELDIIAPVPRPKWMQFLYAPVHFMEQFPSFAAVFQRYRLWCEELFYEGPR
ncbi:hypothetical protein DES53_102920 [Roseimicrobium gellanilyticum]|uniref:Uncharacterized protein n=1 Tax=Roseimicrobium gellanilyticum TaxID=748857 RepID=A0A366HTF5_9BACT|nr:hypothetical protein DES53_102920 [Roseimicrobium gellanilyticum]